MSAFILPKGCLPHLDPVCLLLGEGGVRKEWALCSLTTPGRAGGLCGGSLLNGASLPSLPAVPQSLISAPCQKDPAYLKAVSRSWGIDNLHPAGTAREPHKSDLLEHTYTDLRTCQKSQLLNIPLPSWKATLKTQPVTQVPFGSTSTHTP